MRIAVIGAGVSGLSAAWLLSSVHEVIVYERESRLGGHANTVEVPFGDDVIPVDAGFIVYNEPAYPNLTALFGHLGVATEKTCMSFAASVNAGAVEYSGQSLSAVFADRRNLASPKFWSMLRDIVRFHRDARRALAEDSLQDESLSAFVARRGYGQPFTDYFLKPMASAIWSTPSARILDFSAAAFIRFYDNHGLLRVLNLPEWRTVSGGARVYVERLAASLLPKARLGARVVSVRRTQSGVEVADASGAVDRFDAAVIASHADEALAMLTDADASERRVLGAFKYQKNKAFVHFDAAHMPRRRRAWSSWNYIGDGEGFAATYWMNRLQNLAAPRDIFVTLNPRAPIRDEDIVAEFDYAHPMFDLDAANAQKEVWSLQGRGGVWFCGAHFGQGFHEDGLQAGLATAEALGGVRRPWRVPNESGRIRLAPAKAAAS
ncbi:NAD(P)/FAD-dependent oxidoreductase [Amphiplicatus metriothermophilus]|nr:FAD-dependent oxidoreductase [Amphiplicatus metriothermophilus]MBB5519684.1 putative NAD/FAD-binding protein [Amphiplicatus metriothermophilus]